MENRILELAIYLEDLAQTGDNTPRCIGVTATEVRDQFGLSSINDARDLMELAAKAGVDLVLQMGANETWTGAKLVHKSVVGRPFWKQIVSALPKRRNVELNKEVARWEGSGLRAQDQMQKALDRLQGLGFWGSYERISGWGYTVTYHAHNTSWGKDNYAWIKVERDNA